ncbi:magnesium and cobalt transport protein CorA [Pararhodospirillum photometricum]|nr:magnesium and cobalt transport protein CorA [Pararhodospirillum photometricum]
MPLHTITDMLNRQKIVENMVRTQGMRRHELVTAVVQKQHTAEVQATLGRLSAAEIGELLESLSAEDAQRLWDLVGEAREDDILWEVSTDLARQLAGSREPRFRQGQVCAYEIKNGRMHVVTITSSRDLENLKPIWIDLLGVSDSERGWIARRYGLELPNPDKLTDLEVSARYYEEEKDEIHLHSNFLLDREGTSRSVPVAFVVHKGILFAVRNEELPVFRLQRLRMRNHPGEISDCMDLMLALYAADVEYSADSLEDTYATLRQVSQQVLSEKVSDEAAASILSAIAEEEDLNSRIRGNMLDTQRAVSFLMRGRFLSPIQLEDAREIIRDIESLNTHTAFLFEKINFLMDATVGFINVNQNKRVSQLTVAGVIFMPLNVLASIGGMSEFSMMTHSVPWPVAYSALILGMILLGWGTYVAVRFYEKRRQRREAQDRVRSE